MKDLVNNLYNCNTREEAEEMLLGYKRKELLEIGKELSLSYLQLKKNKKELIEHIVNSTTGSRLRTEAIATIDLGRVWNG